MVLSNFKNRHRLGAFLCRYRDCPRSEQGFGSSELRQKHEDSHSPIFRCTESTCGYYGWTYKTRSAMQKHIGSYHTTEHPANIPNTLNQKALSLSRTMRELSRFIDVSDLDWRMLSAELQRQQSMNQRHDERARELKAQRVAKQEEVREQLKKTTYKLNSYEAFVSTSPYSQAQRTPQLQENEVERKRRFNEILSEVVPDRPAVTMSQQTREAMATELYNARYMVQRSFENILLSIAL